MENGIEKYSNRPIEGIEIEIIPNPRPKPLVEVIPQPIYGTQIEVIPQPTYGAFIERLPYPRRTEGPERMF
jgi:hypothetical protein